MSKVIDFIAAIAATMSLILSIVAIGMHDFRTVIEAGLLFIISYMIGRSNEVKDEKKNR